MNDFKPYTYLKAYAPYIWLQILEEESQDLEVWLDVTAGWILHLREGKEMPPELNIHTEESLIKAYELIEDRLGKENIEGILRCHGYEVYINRGPDLLVE